MDIEGKLDKQCLHRRFGKGFKGVSLQITSDLEKIRQSELLDDY